MKNEESKNAIHLRRCMKEVSEGLTLLQMIIDTNTLYRREMINSIKNLLDS